MSVPDFLRSCPLFFELDDDEIEKIARRCTVLYFSEGQYVFHEGDVGDKIYVVLNGIVELQKSTPDGPISIQSLTQGDIFGEMVLIEGTNYCSDVQAKTVARVLEIEYKTLTSLHKGKPALFGLIAFNLSRIIARRLQELNQLTYGFRV